MKQKAALASRLLLGLIFFVFGLNGFLNFMPPPPGMPEAALKFAGALAETGYMFPMIKGTEVIGGLLLLSGFFVPLALTILAPVIINIFAFHLFLAPSGLALPIVIVALEIFTAWSYCETFKPMLSRKPKMSSC